MDNTTEVQKNGEGFLVFSAPLSKRGVITIPSQIRKHLRLQIGDLVEVRLRVDEDYLTITAPLQINGVITIPLRIRTHLGVGQGDLVEARLRAV